VLLVVIDLYPQRDYAVLIGYDCIVMAIFKKGEPSVIKVEHIILIGKAALLK